MQRYAVKDASKAQPRQVKGLIATEQQQLAQAAADRRSLHQPVAGKTQGEALARMNRPFPITMISPAPNGGNEQCATLCARYSRGSESWTEDG